MNNKQTMEVIDFEKEVIKESFDLPIVVDFWAPWCRPCLVLSPVLEKLADTYKGKWKLLKVNVDNNRELSAKFGVKGIPNVIIFKNGNGVDSFTGALPEVEVLKWLDKHVPNEIQSEIREADKLNKEGKIKEAKELLEDVLAKDPDNLSAKVSLAATVVFEHSEYAEELVHTIYEGGELHQKASDVRTMIRLFDALDDKNNLPDDPAKEQYIRSIELLRKRDFDNALEGFIQVMIQNKEYHDDGARRGSIAIFHWLGEEHPISQKHRTLFNRSIY